MSTIIRARTYAQLLFYAIAITLVGVLLIVFDVTNANDQAHLYQETASAVGDLTVIGEDRSTTNQLSPIVVVRGSNVEVLASHNKDYTVGGQIRVRYTTSGQPLATFALNKPNPVLTHAMLGLGVFFIAVGLVLSWLFASRYRTGGYRLSDSLTKPLTKRKG